MTIGGLKKTSSPLALVAAAGFLMGGMALTPAVAADLGGDCCADLEERVAELEATTARKGNRKVSLTVSGWVARDFGWIEDEDGDSEFYSAGHGVSGSRFQFAGSAALTSSWTIGYTLRARVTQDRNSGTLDEAGASHGPGFVAPLKTDNNFIYLKNARLGTFVFGHAYVPTDGVAEISLGGHNITGTSEASIWNATSLNGFNLEQGVHETVAWVSPTLRGFTFSIAWADIDDNAVGSAGVDLWDMALRYAAEFGPIRLAAGIGYTVNDHSTNAANQDVDGSSVTGSIAVIHTPTGLNVSFAAGTEIDGGVLSSNVNSMPTYTVTGTGVGDCSVAGNCTSSSSTKLADTFDQQYWHIAGGVNRDFTGLGNTSIYGEYGSYDYDGGQNDVTMWGLGVVQHFDAAATELYIAYRNWDEDVSDKSVDQVMAGARIKF